MSTKKTDENLIAQNKKARHDYFVEDTYEAGLVLTGTEIKSVRSRGVQIVDAFVRIKAGEAFVHHMHIAEFKGGNRFNHVPDRTRKLLLHKKELSKLTGIQQQTGYSLIPLKVYLKGGYAKLLIGVCKGKKNYDKRQALKEKDAKRDIEKALKAKLR
ncbi:MAG: SsrA-binding protein SmpB [Defluviitaleaceae bacterium]|nr:SsrA-binding protein SmpB [Defluviitaleaceae bacterium]